jgi:acetolactate synthase-1/2/3 large subunit
MGATGYRATNRKEFDEALKKALASKTPVLIDAIIDNDDKVWPMVAPGAPISETFTAADLKEQEATKPSNSKKKSVKTSV